MEDDKIVDNEIKNKVKKIEKRQEWYTIQQTAEVFRCSYALIRNNIKKGQIPHRKIGKKIFIPAKWIHNMSEENKTEFLPQHEKTCSICGQSGLHVCEEKKEKDNKNSI